MMLHGRWLRLRINVLSFRDWSLWIHNGKIIEIATRTTEALAILNQVAHRDRGFDAISVD
jgi:hypothetical protein